MMQRLVYLEGIIEQRGDPRGHLGREVLTLTWAIESLRDLDADICALIPQAEAIAEHRIERSRQRTAERAAQGG
jgi:hypothetical protein